MRKHGKKENPRGGGVSFDQSVNKMQIETLNGEKILVKCKFQLNQNLNLNLYRKANSIKISFGFVSRDTKEFEFLDFF